MGILSDLSFRSADRLIPYQASFELTYNCNERCGHCYLTTYDDRKDGRPPLSLEEWKGILDQLAEAGTLVLILMGGEAMLHPSFWEIARHAAERQFALSLITNGLLLDEKAADRMAELGFYNVTVSLYSLDPLIHDQMTRRKGSHQKTMEALGRLRARKIDCVVNCLLTSRNIDSCFALEDWGRAQGIRVRFDPMVTPKADGALDPTVTRASIGQLRAYYEKLKERGVKVEAFSGSAEDAVCNQGRGKCAVNAYGDLLTCLDVRDALGNLRERTFQELWSSEKARSLRGLKNSDLHFDPVSGDGAYADHCPGMAQAETGDYRAPVPFLMEMGRIKREVFGTR